MSFTLPPPAGPVIPGQHTAQANPFADSTQCMPGHIAHPPEHMTPIRAAFIARAAEHAKLVGADVYRLRVEDLVPWAQKMVTEQPGLEGWWTTVTAPGQPFYHVEHPTATDSAATAAQAYATAQPAAPTAVPISMAQLATVEDMPAPPTELGTKSLAELHALYAATKAAYDAGHEQIDPWEKAFKDQLDKLELAIYANIQGEAATLDGVTYAKKEKIVFSTRAGEADAFYDWVTKSGRTDLLTRGIKSTAVQAEYEGAVAKYNAEIAAGVTNPVPISERVPPHTQAIVRPSLSITKAKSRNLVKE